MVLAVEIIVCCLIFGIYRVIRIKRDPAYKISNMPEKLQKKVMHMRGYSCLLYTSPSPRD